MWRNPPATKFAKKAALKTKQKSDAQKGPNIQRITGGKTKKVKGTRDGTEEGADRQGSPSTKNLISGSLWTPKTEAGLAVK